MAEIGLVASIVGLVGFGGKPSVSIFDLASTIGSAGKELQNVGMEISSLCSVLDQLQEILEHAHFNPSTAAKKDARKLIEECKRILAEIDDIITGLRSAKLDDPFPSVDFTSKAKWAFSKRSKVMVLRSTLESCKLTLSLMLNTMQRAERLSQSKPSSAVGLDENEKDKLMTQSLVISQQCAVEQLEHWEDEVEKEQDAAMLLPGVDASTRPLDQKRRKSRGRLVNMFSGLSIITDLPTLAAEHELPPNRAERASVWLDSILALENEWTGEHPGRLRQKLRRLSSVQTADAPKQLLKKWTESSDHLDGHLKAQSTPEVHDWRDNRFSFSSTVRSTTSERNEPPRTAHHPSTTFHRVPTDLVSPKTARMLSIGFSEVFNVDGSLETATATIHGPERDTYENIQTTILREFGLPEADSGTELCIAYGGKIKRLKQAEQPLKIFRQFNEMELEPRFLLRRLQNPPP